MENGTRPPKTPSQPLTEFHLFPTLPTEMRLKIWNLAMIPTPRIISIYAVEFQLVSPSTFPKGTCPQPSSSDLVSPTGGHLLPRASTEGLFSTIAPHRLLFVCRESYLLVMERCQLRWRFTIPGHNAERNAPRPKFRHLAPLPNETWASAPVTSYFTFSFERRRHFLAQGPASRQKSALLDLENDIVRLMPPSKERLMPFARMDVMIRWFPNLPNIRRFMISFDCLFYILVSETTWLGTPHHLIKLKGLRELIITLDKYFDGFPAWFQDQHRRPGDRLSFVQRTMEDHFKRYEAQYPDWKRPALRIVGNETEL